MERYKEIKDIIQRKYKNLPKNQQGIAEYFINNFDRIPFLTVQDVSTSSSTSVASVVRFAQRLGFSGFSEIRNAIASSLQDHLTNKEFFPLFKKIGTEKDLFNSVANLDIQNINNTLAIIERTKFNKAIEMIIKSDRIYTAGLGVSYFLAEILAYQFTQVGVDAAALTHSHSLFQEQILYFKKNDLFITFSFPPYSKDTIAAAKFAQEKNLKVISITNKEASPISFHSSLTLLVKSENMLFTNSFAAISVLINAIATTCAIENKSKSKKLLTEFGKIMIEQNQNMT